jgi:hypothetical protein
MSHNAPNCPKCGVLFDHTPECEIGKNEVRQQHIRHLHKLIDELPVLKLEDYHRIETFLVEAVFNIKDIEEENDV